MRELRKRFTSFVLVGVIATAIHFGVLILLVQGFGVLPTWASTAGFLLSAVANYALNYRLTFNSDKPHVEAAGKFVVVLTAGMLGNAALMHTGTAILGWPYLLVQLGTTVMILFWHFFGNYLWSFRARAGS